MSIATLDDLFMSKTYQMLLIFLTYYNSYQGLVLHWNNILLYNA